MLSVFLVKHMIGSFIFGITEASRSWKMILLILAANILLSIPVVIPIFLLIVNTSGGTLSANRLMADKLDAIWLIDLINHQFPGAAIETTVFQIGIPLFAIGSIYLLLNTLFAGGVIGVFNSADGLFTMRKFWGDAGAYFWRFFRLALISLIFYGAAIGVYALLQWRIKSASALASAFEPLIYFRWAAIAMLALTLGFVNMIFDYAKIGTVVHSERADSKNMLRETYRACCFAYSNFFTAFGLYLLISIVGFVVFLGFNTLRWSVDQSSIGKVFLAILLGQMAIAAGLWTRLFFYAAEMHLYKKLAPVTTPETMSVEPQIEFARADAPERRIS